MPPPGEKQSFEFALVTDRKLHVLIIVDAFSALEPRFTFRGADVVEVLDKLLCADLVRASEEI